MTNPSHGSKAGLLVSGYDLSPFLNTLNDGVTVDTAESTTFGPLGSPVTAKSYIPGMEDATLDGSGNFVVDNAVGAPNKDQIADVLEAAIRAATKPICVRFPFGDGFGVNCTGMEADENSYAVDSPINAVVKVTTKLMASGGAEPLAVLHALAQEAAPGVPGATLDAGATYLPAKWKALVAYLHVTNVGGAGPSLTCKVQHSADNATWVDLATFAAVTQKHQAQRIIVASGAINRYLRANWSIAAGTTATFHLAAGRVPA